jgi:subtilisin family serine protease
MKTNFNLKRHEWQMRPFISSIFLLIVISVSAQESITTPGKLWFHILDESARPNGVTTMNQQLNQTFSTFNVSGFEQVFSFSKSQFLRDTYELTCNCDEELLMNILKTNHTDLVGDVEPVYVAQLIYDPTDYFWWTQLYEDYDWMWYMENIEANTAWDLTHGNPCVRVAVADGGVDITHPDLVGKVEPPYDFYTGGTLVSSGFGYEHGNHVAGILAAETSEIGETAAGQSLSVGFDTKVMASKSMGLASMLYASTVLRADILSVSWYFSCTSSVYGLAVEQEINDNGTLIVKAAGNMLTDFTNHCGGGGLYPFSGFEDERTVIVSGSWKDDRHAANIDWNYDGEPDVVSHNHNSAVDFCAPSYQILSLYSTINNGVVNEWPYGGMGGTSQSAPLTAATAALMKSVNPCMNNLDMAKLLEQTTYPLLDAADYPGQVGTGRLNAYGAVFASLTHGTVNPIVSNTTWSDADKYVSTDVLVESGTLTITGTVRFANDARLIIKPGAKVVVDGGLLTASKCSCSDELFWPGIEVWGQSTERQLASLQGTLELKNGAIIEHAGCAVRLGNLVSTDPWTYDWGKTGGIVKSTTNSVFRNNRKDVEFLAYQNYQIVLGQYQLRKNVSYFYDTEFLIAEVLPNVANLGQRVSLFDVDGIRFRSCNFHIEGDALSNYSIQNRGYGIYSLVSSFDVQSRCAVPVPLGSECDPGYLTAETLGEPDSDIIPSRFSNYLTAIRSVGADGFANTSVSGTIFTGNQMGIFLKTVDQASIKRNRFFIDEQNYFIAFGRLHRLCCGAQHL